MFKRKKKKRNEFREINFQIEGKEEKKLDMPIQIGEEDDYAVLEPFDLSKRKKDIHKETMEVNKETNEEKIKPKLSEEKPKLIIKKTEPKEVGSKPPVQNVPSKPIIQPSKLEESISKIPIDHIETDIDKLMKIIDEKKIIGLEELSKILKINPDRLEIWAKILEDSGLIEIEYPILGLPKLRKKEWKTKS